jgi:hypothetical protein
MPGHSPLTNHCGLHIARRKLPPAEPVPTVASGPPLGFSPNPVKSKQNGRFPCCKRERDKIQQHAQQTG